MPQNETWYFSYGSNLSKEQMLSRTGSVPYSQKATLTNYRLAFRRTLNGRSVYATIVPEPGSLVQGVAYLCSDYAMSRLDILEGVAQHCYRRETVRVDTLDRKHLDCVVYVGESFFEEEDYPADDYLNRILTGASEHLLPQSYIDTVAKIARPS